MKDMHRFLVITELFLPTKGGTAVWFDEVYRRIGDRRTHIVTAEVLGCEEHDRDHPNSIHRLKLRRVPWLRPESIIMYLKLFTYSLWLALTERYTAVHAGRALPEGLVAWMIGRLTFHPVVLYAHGEELTSWGRGAKFRALQFVLRRADKIIANSEYTRDQLVKLKVLKERIVLINPGVDIARFRSDLVCDDLRNRIGLTTGQYLLLSVGRLSRRKGFDEVIKSLPGIREAGHDVHYAVIGVGEDRDYLMTLAKERGVEAWVRLLGSVSSDDLPRWYNACDVFVMPNRDIEGDTEGFGMVFMEAAACGKPVIAGLAGGTGSAVLDGVTGIRVDGRSSGEIKKAVVCLFNNAELAKSMGDAGRSRAYKEFSWTTVANRILRESN